MYVKLLRYRTVALLLALCLLFGLAGCSNANAPPLLDTVPAERQTPAISSVPDKEVADSSPQGAYGTLEIVYLNVGQGDSIYVSLPNGETVLIDAGETSAGGDIIQFIKNNNGKGTIDYLIATHPHSDHIGGMAAVINAFEVKNIWMPDATHTTIAFESLLDTIASKGLEIQIAEAGETLFDFGSIKAEFVAPCGGGYSNLNNYSAVLRLTYNDKHFLFMGDAEKEAEAEILKAGCDISADVLKVGHHGSSSSSTEAFIKAVSPKYAVISCGAGNSYGHPTIQTLAVLTEHDVTIKRTDESGTIIFFCDGDGNISLTTFESEIQPRAPNTAPAEPATTSAEDETPAKTQEQSITVYVTKTGSKYHADGCRYLSNSKIPMDLETARQHYEPCSVCKPSQ